MLRERRLAILLALLALSATVYYVALRPISLEGVVDHKTITGAREGTSYSIVIFTSAGNHFDDKEVRSLFDETNQVNDTVVYQLEARYDEVFYIVSVRSGDDTVGYLVNRKDFNSVVPGSRILYRAQSSDEPKISIKKVLD